jgi:hypothetical protein
MATRALAWFDNVVCICKWAFVATITLCERHVGWVGFTLFAESELGLPPKDLAQCACLRPTQVHLFSGGQPQLVASFEPGDDLLHPAQVDDGRAMGTEKRGRVQPRGQLGKRATDRVSLISHVHDSLLILEADPVYLVCIWNTDVLTVSHCK